MSEEDTGIEKQIINMIKNVLVDEENEEEKRNEKEVKFNLKLLDLSSPVYQRKERKLQNQSDKQLIFQASGFRDPVEYIDVSGANSISTLNESKRISEEKSPRDPNWSKPSLSSTNNANFTNISNSNNNLNFNSKTYLPYDYQSLLINNSLNSTNSSVFLDTSTLLKKQRTPRAVSSENLKLLIDSDDLESRMLSIEFIDEEIYEKLKGSFLEIITNQNCSRILQNCLHTIPQSILSKILLEVRSFITLGL
jgi:hypothetical protein